MSSAGQEPPAPTALADRLDRAHLAVYRAMPEDLLLLDDIPTTRQRVAALRASMPQPPRPDGLQVEDHEVPFGDGAVGTVRTYRPAGVTTPVPALYWIHGGGLVLGDLDMDDAWCAATAHELGIVVAAVDYRLAPDHPYPTPVEDCFAGLRWLAESAAPLGVEPARIAVGGSSAGGGLAAATVLLARDRGAPAVAFQLLVYPMLDDRDHASSSPSAHDPKVWNRRANAAGWAAYLGDEVGGPDVAPYAAPARAINLTGLPPTHISVGDLDLFLDEDLDFGRRLAAAGVPVELHVFPGAFHGSDTFVSRSALSQRWLREQRAALSRGLGID